MTSSATSSLVSALDRLREEILPRDAKPAAVGRPPPLRMADLDDPGDDAEFLWRGLLAVGGVTVVAGEPKAGKSYMVAGLIAALERGEPFLGIQTSQARAFLLSEEPKSTLRAKRDRFGWRDVLVRPRAHAFPRRSAFQVIEEATEEALAAGARLLTVDTWAHWMNLGPDRENDAGATTEALQPLLQAAGRGLAVLVVHHVSKLDRSGVSALRGSSALAGGVDVVGVWRKAQGGKARRLTAEGRWESSAVDVLGELEGDRYRALGTPAQAALGEVGERALATIRVRPWVAQEALCRSLGGRRERVLEVLEEILATGAVHRIGTGQRGSPFRYALSTVPTPVGDSVPESRESMGMDGTE